MESQLQKQAAVVIDLQHQLDSSTVSEATMQRHAVSIKHHRLGIAELKIQFQGLAARVKANTDATVLLTRLAGKQNAPDIASHKVDEGEHMERCPNHL